MQLAPETVAATRHDGPARTQAVSLEELLPQLVRRIAWAGDRRKGSAALELGGGRYAGTTVVVHADDGRVRVEVDGPEADALRARIAERLDRRGIAVQSVT